MPERLRVGVVGGGAVLERYHIPAINAVPEVVRSIVVDVDRDRAERVALRYGFPTSSGELGDVVRHADIAIVLVPNGLHASISCELLTQGIHVLCEKPMARNSEECKAMIDASVRGRAKLCIGHNRRFQQHMKLAKQIIDKGLIGEIVGVTGRRRKLRRLGPIGRHILILWFRVAEHCSMSEFTRLTLSAGSPASSKRSNTKAMAQKKLSKAKLVFLSASQMAPPGHCL